MSLMDAKRDSSLIHNINENDHRLKLSSKKGVHGFAAAEEQKEIAFGQPVLVMEHDFVVNSDRATSVDKRQEVLQGMKPFEIKVDTEQKRMEQIDANRLGQLIEGDVGEQSIQEENKINFSLTENSCDFNISSKQSDMDEDDLEDAPAPTPDADLPNGAIGNLSSHFEKYASNPVTSKPTPL